MRSRKEVSFRADTGFTLIELLVTMSILLILTGMTFTVVNVTMDSDRIRSGAAQVQSFLEGARDRAIYSGTPVGVRFILDPNDTTTANSMIYVGTGDTGTISGFLMLNNEVDADFDGAADVDTNNNTQILDLEGTLTLREDVNNDGSIVMPEVDCDGDGLLDDDAPMWRRFTDRGQITNGSRIIIDGVAYTLARDGHSEVGWRLTRAFHAAIPSPAGLLCQEYELELAPVVLPSQEPRALPRNVGVDLDESIRPPAWGAPPTYADRLDILFSPRGTVIGDAANAGLIHLVIADAVDTIRNLDVGDSAQKQGNELIVTVATQTGKISVHPVKPIDPMVNPNEAFDFAISAEVAK